MRPDCLTAAPAATASYVDSATGENDKGNIFVRQTTCILFATLKYLLSCIHKFVQTECVDVVLINRHCVFHMVYNNMQISCLRNVDQILAASVGYVL